MRIQRSLFRGDDFAQTQAVTVLRSEFEKNRHVTDENEVERLLSEGHDAAEFLKLNVVQAKLNDRGNYGKIQRFIHLNIASVINFRLRKVFLASFCTAITCRPFPSLLGYS